jgi:hypothetical protein
MGRDLRECDGKQYNCYKCIGHVIKCLGHIVLGVGTLFLGLAAFYKADDIYEVVKVIKGLDTAVQTIQQIERDNHTILTRIENQNKGLSIVIASSVVDKLSFENPSDQKKELNRVLQDYGSPSFSNVKASIQDRKSVQVNDISHMLNLNRQEKIRYLSNIIEKRLNSDSFNP